MQIVSSTLSQAPGQPSLSAQPGKDDGSTAFAGLLAALSGVTGLMTQVAASDPAFIPSGSSPSSRLAAGAYPGPGGPASGFPAPEPASSVLAATMAGASPAALAQGRPVSSAPVSTLAAALAGAVPSPAALAQGPPVSSAPVSADVSPGAAGTDSPPAVQAAATSGGQWTQAMPAGALISGATPPSGVTAAAPLQATGYLPEAGVAGSGQGPTGPALVSDFPAAQAAVTATPTAVWGQTSKAAVVQVPPQAVQASGNPAYPGTLPGVHVGVGDVVTGGVTLPGAQVPAASGNVGAGPAAVSAQAAPTPQQAAGGNPPMQVAPANPSGAGTGYPGVVAAAQAVLSAPVTSPNQGQAPAPAAPTAAGQTVQVSVNSAKPQSAPDSGSTSSGGDGKGTDPGQTPTNPLAGMFQASPANGGPGTAVVPVASLPHQTAQNIMSYLNQGGRLPAQLQLQLDPPALGKMTVHLAMEAGTLAVTFVTATSHARDAVAASLPQMRELFSQNNLALGHTGVYVGSQSAGRENAGGNPRFDQHRGPDIGFLAPAASEEEGTVSPVQPGLGLLNILV